MKRRHFLSAGAAALLSGSGGLLPGRTANAQSVRFGDLNALPGGNPWRPSFPSERPIQRVLEVFVYGGLSPWETFYVNPATLASSGTCGSSCGSLGVSSGQTQWGTYSCQFRTLAEADTRRPADPDMTPNFTKEFFEGIHLGPATWPLWRSDLFDHLQVLVTNHDLLPHEAAVPYSLTGTRLGRPTLAGTGAVINKSRQDSSVPASFVLKGPGGTAADNFIASTASGMLGSPFKPIFLETKCGLNQLDQLDRTPTPSQDDLLRYYLRQYERRLTWPGAGQRARSQVLSDYEATLNQLFNLQQIASQVQGFDASDATHTSGTEPSCILSGGDYCSGQASELSGIRQALSLAAHLLNLPTTRYVCVIDTGRQNAGGAGYDTHADHAQTTYRNLTNTLEVIAKLTDPSQPGGPRLDPFTAIVITTEFGRTPTPEGGTGRGHYPYAYTNLIIPPNNAIKPRPRKRILGGIDENGRVFSRFGSQIAAVTPTDLRGALLLGLGVDPFAQDVFGVGNFSEPLAQGAEVTARDNLIKEVLGYVV
jgi:hypothetical protein